MWNKKRTLKMVRDAVSVFLQIMFYIIIIRIFYSLKIGNPAIFFRI